MSAYGVGQKFEKVKDKKASDIELYYQEDQSSKGVLQ
jgi:hypothetical protein